MAYILRARLGVDPEQIVDEQHDALGHTLARGHLIRFVKLTPRMAPTGGMHQLRAAHLVISGIAIGLQRSVESCQKFPRTLAPPPSRKSNTTLPPGRTGGSVSVLGAVITRAVIRG